MMKDWMQVRWFNLMESWIPRMCEAIVMRIAGLLPRRVAYWATVRVTAHATTGEFSNTNPGELNCVDVLKRWDTN